MDSKKRRRSSILKKNNDEDNTVDFEAKLKRRISFSGKKSVRVFCREEETKTYNNSYEESDNTANTSEESKHKTDEINKHTTVQNVVQNVQITTNINDKENIYGGNYTTISYQKQSSQKMLQISRSSILSDKFGGNGLPISLHTTMDFINNSQISEPFRIENSIDISLLDQERSLRNSTKRASFQGKPSIEGVNMSMQNETAAPLTSFSVEEHELDMLRNAKAGNYLFTEHSFNNSIHSALNSTKLTECTNKSIMKASKFVSANNASDYNENMNSEFVGNQTKSSLNRQKGSISEKVNLGRTLFNQSTNMDQDFTYSIPRLKRNTILHSQNMEIEQGAGMPNTQSISRNVRDCIGSKTVIADCSMDIEQDYNHQEDKLNIGSGIDLHKKSKLHENAKKVANNETNSQIAMDLSMNLSDDRVVKGNNENINSINLRRTINYKDMSNKLGQDLDISIVESDKLPMDAIKKQRKSIVFGNSACSELDISKHKQENNAKTVKDVYGQNNKCIEAVKELQISKNANGENKEVLGKKIINYLKTQNLDVMEVENVAESKPSCTILGVSDKKGAVPKVVVVRKVCNTNLKQESVEDLQKQRFQRYQNKQKQDENICNKANENSGKTIEKPNNIDSLFLDSESMLMSPDFHSPIYPPICVGGKSKKYNFRQLNDEIENGNIQLFPDISQTPKNKDIKMRNQQISYNQDENPQDNLRLENNFYKKLEKSSDLKKDFFTEDKKKDKGKICLFSEADDIQLDDTVFLTQAKLGDETVSRNSTKCSISKIDINPNGEIDMTMDNSNNNIIVNRDVEKPSTTFHATEDISLAQLKANNENDEQGNEYKTNITNQKLELSPSVNKTIIYEEENDMQCDVSKFEEHNDENNKNENVQNAHADVLRNNNETNPNNYSISKRQTVYYKKEYEIDVDHSIIENSTKMDSNTIPNKDKCITRNKRQTLHFTENNDVELDESILTRNTNQEPVEEADVLQKHDVSNANKYSISKRQSVYYTKENEMDVDHSIIANAVNLELNKIPIKDKCIARNKRQTLHFTENNDVELDESILTRNTNQEPVEEADVLRRNGESNANKYSFSTRQSTYYTKEHEMDVDHSIIENPVNLESNNIQNKDICTTRNKRQTLHFTEKNDVELDESILTRNTNQEPVEEADVLRKNGESNANKYSISTRLQEYEMDVEHSIIANSANLESNNIQNKDICTTRNKRQTLHFTENNDLELDESILTSKTNIASCAGYSQRRQTLNRTKRNDTDIEQTSFADGTMKKAETEKAVHFPNPLNAAKLALSRKSSINKSVKKMGNLDDSLLAKLKEVRESTFKKDRKTIYCDNPMDLEDSPARNTREQEDNLRRLYEGTPHRSVIEFEYLEIEAEKDEGNCEQILDSSKLPKPMNDHVHKLADNKLTESVSKIDVHRKINFSNEDMPIDENTMKGNRRRHTSYQTVDILEESGLQSIDACDDMEDSKLISPKAHASEKEKFNKRSTVHLTPIYSTSKKRNTLFFNNYDLEESIVHKGESKSVEKSVESSYSQVDVKHKQVDDMDVTLEYNTNNTDALHHDINVSKSQSLCKSIAIAKCESIIIDSEEDKRPEISIAEKPLQSSPARLSVSRIPILLESAKKNNSIVSRFLSSPRKTNENNLDHSLETIEIPRRATTFNRRESHVKIPSDRNSVIERNELFEDNPITISDVSVFYMSQKQNKEAPCIENQSFDQELVSAHKFSTEMCEDTTVNNIAKFKKRYIDLTCESPELNCGLDDIDMTRLSLVETLMDDDEVEENIPNVIGDKTSASCNQPIAKVQKSSRLSIADLKNNSVMCRKCKRCKESFLNDTASTADSFILPEMPPIPDIGMERLNKLRSKPTIAETEQYWLLKNFNQDTRIENLSFDDFYSERDEDEDEKSDEVDKFIIEYKEKWKRTEKEIAVLYSGKSSSRIRTFVSRLDERLSSTLPNWIFDYQLQELNCYRFDHKKLKTFTIALNYLQKDPMENNIQVKDVQLQTSIFETKNWKPIDFVFDFQLKLELPFDLCSYFQPNGIDGVYEMLKQIDQLCKGVEDLGFKFLRVVYNEKATVIREANACFVKKIVRKVIPRGEVQYGRVKKLEFKIVITNIRKICYKDIVSPPLHMFREDVQYLPTGIDFLCAFLANPEAHLRKLRI